ncbi:MAG: hypothetical protein EXS16_21460, partial [Gemmataceae bacterium]|nr:hypothetical protein [Gemmataceae bacterium]
MSYSTDSARPRKVQPQKLPPHSPFFIHKAGYFAKKIRGATKYFGRIDDGHDEALKRFVAEKDSLYAGVAVDADAMTLRDLLNRFLTAKNEKVQLAEMKSRTFDELKNTCEVACSVLKKSTPLTAIGPIGFAKLRRELAKRCGPVRLANEIQRVRSLFNFAYKNGYIKNPQQFGAGFDKPSRSVIRKAKHAKGPRMFSAGEIQTLLDNANLQLRAMILLAINAGFGAEDCGRLTTDAVNIESGWIDFARPKTGILRRAKLWPETCNALRAVVAENRRPCQRNFGKLFFLTAFGGPWTSDANGATAVTHEFSKLMAKAEVARPGVGFYGLRHAFRTAADGCKDQPASDRVMGHETEG